MAIAGAIAAVIGAAYAIYSGETGRTEKRWAAGDQERADLKENDERVRRQGERNEQIQSTTRARAAAAGVSSTAPGSTSNFILEQKKESTRQLDWMKSAGTESAKLRRETGIAQGDYMQQQGMASGISQLGQAGKSFSQTDWYKQNF